MTIPSRPAPAPPVGRGQNAAAGANASIEQLRMQLQQQQLQQQQNGGIQKMTFNIPPPPTRPSTQSMIKRNSSIISNNNSYASFSMESNQTAITRKFPQARYTPATNWDDDPFSVGNNRSITTTSSINTNGNFKKVPPPRPPPPKVQVNGRKAPQPPTAQNQSTKLLNNIFRLKKSNSNNNNNNNSNKANKVYGVSSGAYAITSTNSSNKATISTTNYSSNNSLTNTWGAAASSNIAANGSSWQANWNSSNTSTAHNSTAAGSSSGIAEAQLISFDSPPSSPTLTQKSNSDCLSVDSFSSDSNFSSPNNGSVSQPESGFEDDFSARSRPATTSPLDPWGAFDGAFNSVGGGGAVVDNIYGTTTSNACNIGTAPVRNLNTINTRIQSSKDNPLCNGKSLLPPTPTVSVPTIIKPKVSLQKSRAPKPPILPKPQFDQCSGNDAPPSPPMPLCAPPPPPPSSSMNCVSLLDVISGKADALQLSGAGNGGFGFDSVDETKPFGIALYDFDGIEEGDLNFRENEKIYILEKVSDEWYRGRTRSGCEGILPINYIDIRVPLKEEATPMPTTNILQQTAKCEPVRVRCLYNFPAEYETDLALKENELVTILYRINEDWLYGEVDNRQGQFPANFLEYIPANIPMG